MTPSQKQQAVRWYALYFYDLQTIADHFKMPIERLKSELSTLKEKD